MTAPLKLSGYSVWQLMELDACTRCGECVAWCPTFAENSHELTHPLGKIARLTSWLRRRHGLRARLCGPRPIADGELAEFAAGVYSCTLCARCREVCPVHIDTRPLWMAMREQLAAAGHYPPALATLRQNVTARYNTAGEDNANRLSWSQNLPSGSAGLAGRRAEVVYFVGCVSAFYPLAYPIPQSLVQVLHKAGVDLTTLGGEEWCCGFPLMVAGLGAEATALARHNVAAVRATGAKTLVATCPSCYHTWQHDYPRLLGEPLGFAVRHATELLAGLVDSGQLKLGPYGVGAVREPPLLTYHDPCDLGRTSGIYEAPRRVLQAIPGVRFTEMRDNRALALCCGGGGDVEMGDAELTAAVARRRLAQAQETGAEVIVSACQQCKRTLTATARREKARLRVLDVTEVVWGAMQGV
ncbi:MAG TPA: (Fe-S)-binding protein [Anaerolineae bacterium]|nr:(Fe-S)-binding protein [Anaerolineae bacterium]HOQ97472.1 (Fe-S)-binding protein [Anaerolineae bacterium]HPL27323.1 (Fe-S)-binding protein [Anaerolineae bacterium]HPL27324.1 (Fe-S)-binding protein [Anaerolineae bacterium]